MKNYLLILLLCICQVCTYAQSCPLNIDFEEGNLKNWQCFVGTTSTNNNKNVIKLRASQPTAGRHEIMAAGADGSIPLDTYGGFPTVCPYGGKYSAKLGNNNTGAEAEGMSYTFTVPSNEDTFTITYFYAVVFENPRHTPPEQPRFFVTAYETATRKTINCASYNYVSEGGIPGFKESKQSSDILYKEWSPVSIQFINLENKQVTLEFKTADCTLSGHFGYAYFDVGAGCSNILATAPYCRETNSLLLNAPYGFQNYVWYNEDYSKVIGNDQNLTLSPPPVTQGRFWVDLIPYPGYGCRDTAYALVNPLPVPDTPAAKTDYFYCQHQAASALSARPAINSYLLWYTDTTKPGNTDAPVPSTAKPGIFTYYVSQKILFGCESFRKKITVQVDPVPVVSFLLNTNAACQEDNKFTCISTSGNLQSPSYEWSFGNGDTLTITDTVSYSYKDYGYFTITLKITNGPVCSESASQQVTVVPTPLAGFSYPDIICQNETNLLIQDKSSVPQQLSQITQWYWAINNDVYETQTPPAFTPAASAEIPVSQVVYTKEGCRSDTLTKIIPVHPQPQAKFTHSNLLCENEIIRFKDESFFAVPTNDKIVSWYWNLDGVPLSVQNPSYQYTPGSHNTTLTVQSDYGCRSITADSVLRVYEKPEATVNINDSCVYRKIIYTANDMLNNISKWYWDFGSGAKEMPAAITKYYYNDGNNSFILYAQTRYGCMDTVIRPFSIYANRATAGNDTIAAINQPVQLNANGGTNNHYTWSPATGLSDAYIEAPVAIYDKDQLYRMDAVTNEGCDAHGTIMIKRYAGPEIYIPTAFTPNHDRLNDILKAFPVGMKKLDYFAVYNRYGERVFYTEDFTKGWDGSVKGMPAQSATFVAVAQATDYTGKAFLKKTTVVLIR